MCGQPLEGTWCQAFPLLAAWSRSSPREQKARATPGTQTPAASPVTAACAGHRRPLPPVPGQVPGEGGKRGSLQGGEAAGTCGRGCALGLRNWACPWGLLSIPLVPAEDMVTCPVLQGTDLGEFLSCFRQSGQRGRPVYLSLV